MALNTVDCVSENVTRVVFASNGLAATGGVTDAVLQDKSGSMVASNRKTVAMLTPNATRCDPLQSCFPA